MSDRQFEFEPSADGDSPDTREPPRPPTSVRQRVDRLVWQRDECGKNQARNTAAMKRVQRYLGIADEVTGALESLNEQLFQQLLQVVQEKLTVALQEVLEQPITFRANVEFKRNASAVEFWIERDGCEEDVYLGQGGSVANVLSVGLRMFALTTLDENEHRRFLVLDEQDCWLRPDLVPRLVKIVHEAGKALGFQVLMISHHDVMAFERYADKIYRFTPTREGPVRVEEVGRAAIETDTADQAD